MVAFFVYTYNLLGDRMIHQIKDFLEDREFRFTVYLDKIHLINIDRIITLEDDRIIVQSNHQFVKIYGTGFILIKLVEKEMLIKGLVTKIEVKND